eukprot:RCo035576
MSAPASPGSSPKKLSPEEQETLAQHLYYQSLERRKALEQKRQEQLAKEAALPELRTLNKEQIEAMVDHLYVQPMSQKTRTAEARQSKLEQGCAIPTKQLSEPEMVDSLERMYYEERRRRQTTHEKLIAKYQAPPKKVSLTPEQAEALNARLYKDYVTQKQDKRKALWEKHVAPLQPQFPKLTAEEAAAVGERLHGGKK